MLAITIDEDHNNDLLWQEVDEPDCGAREVIVRVHATAVNRADLLQRAGLYPPPPGASPILGLEAAGVVEAVGADVDESLIGGRVACLLSGGGYAQKVAVPADHLLAIPETMSFEEAAAIPEVFYTAYLNLFIEAGAREGETAMIHAAASGVGTAALQLCRAFGVQTIATASGGKLGALPAYGADFTVDRNEQDFAEVALEVTSGRGVDVILDPVGANYLESNLQSLGVGGRLVLIGLLSGNRAELDLGRLLRSRIRVIGSVLRSRSIEEKTAITESFRARVLPRFSDGTLRPVIDRVVDITDAHEAHAALRTNETVGKVVLRVP